MPSKWLRYLECCICCKLFLFASRQCFSSEWVRCSTTSSGHIASPALDCNFSILQSIGVEWALPDVKAYYRAAHLTRVVDWHCHAEAKHWVAMEIEDSKDTTKSWPWIASPLPKSLIEHPTLGSTLLVARDAFLHSLVSPLPSPMAPVLGNPEFPPILKILISRDWTWVGGAIFVTLWVPTVSFPPLQGYLPRILPWTSEMAFSYAIFFGDAWGLWA